MEEELEVDKEDETVDEESNDPPTRKKLRTTPEDDGDDLDGFDTSFQGSPIRANRRNAKQNSSPSQSTKRAAPVVEDEEEHSLLEPREPKPKPQSQVPPPPPEEPSGPKSRLVIHKMALVNFKSYAGRQEIGPFHKACFRVDHDLYNPY